MYPNLLAEMARRKVNAKELAVKLGITQSTFSMKMSGKSVFSLNEAKRIKNILGTDESIEFLFKAEEA